MTLREFKEKYGSGADAVIDPLAAVVGGKKDKVPKPSAARPPLPSKQPGNHKHLSFHISSHHYTEKDSKGFILAMDNGGQIDFSKLNVSELGQQARLEILQKLSSAINQIQSFEIK